MKEILGLIEMYYERMNNCASTSGKSNNGHKIILILEDNPRATNYWKYDPNRRAWADRFTKIREYSDSLDDYAIVNDFNIRNGIVIDEITDLKRAPSVRGVYLLGNCTCNPYTNQKQYWIKVGRAKNISQRMGAYTTCCPCTALLDTLETEQDVAVENICQSLLSDNSVGRCQINREWWLVDEKMYKGISEQKFNYFKNPQGVGLRDLLSLLS